MTEKIFISYSRRELGFVDDLVNKLEEKYQVWLDYRALIPGVPWAEQIDKGLREADTVILVVSKASLGSEFVALEWRHFLEAKKRVILVVFEAVDLPTELEKFEWVDFRGNYKAGLDELFSQLDQPIQEEHPVPETGFKAPAMVWGVAALSILVAILSLGAFWTIFIPIFLVPLPYRIFKRSFDFSRVQVALLALPVALSLAHLVFIGGVDGHLLTSFLIGMSFGLLGWLLLWLLRSSAMSRWGRPEATALKFANPYDPNVSNPVTVSYYIDHAPEDRFVAEELSGTLKKYGHSQAADIKSAKSVFALISKFKGDTEANPDTQVVFPVMVQTNYDIPRNLSKIQWIDFRPGVRGLDVIAQLLADPAAMLKALGMRPVSSQTVYPPMITILYYFTLFMTAIFIGTVIDMVFFAQLHTVLGDLAFSELVAMLVVGGLLYVGNSTLMARGLLNRDGFYADPLRIAIGVLVQGLLSVAVWILDRSVVFMVAEDLGGEIGYAFATFGITIYLIGIGLLMFNYFRNRRDIRLWFPAKR
ncbi:MAG: toll/interleukin-1 receptor domain-containing protein [Anaerolineales bacterium]|nr:toll/interleukin-1 receptor domain-containing protein [Anaerolineales bacterium]